MDLGLSPSWVFGHLTRAFTRLPRGEALLQYYLHIDLRGDKIS